MTTSGTRLERRFAFVLAFSLLAAACQTAPKVTSETAPGAKVDAYRTFGFVDQPTTDAPGYTTKTTGYLKDAVTREMVARGYEFSTEPELVVDFVVAIVEQGEKEEMSVVSGGSGGSGGAQAGGVGINMGNVFRAPGAESVLRIDVIDRQQRLAIWGGSLKQRVPEDQKEYSQPMISAAVRSIFEKYPKPVVGALQSSTEQPPK